MNPSKLYLLFVVKNKHVWVIITRFILIRVCHGTLACPLVNLGLKKFESHRSKATKTQESLVPADYTQMETYILVLYIFHLCQ